MGTIAVKELEVSDKGLGLLSGQIGNLISNVFNRLVFVEDKPKLREAIGSALKKLGIQNTTIYKSNLEMIQTELESDVLLYEIENTLYAVDIDTACQVGNKTGLRGNKAGVLACKRLKARTKHTTVIYYSSKLNTVTNKDRRISQPDGEVERSGNVEADICTIIIGGVSRKLNHLMAYDDSFTDDQIESQFQKNYSAFKDLMDDENWVKKHHGKYVAIVDGHFIKEDDNEKILISNVKEVKSQVLIEKVGEPFVVELLTPYHMYIDAD